MQVSKNTTDVSSTHSSNQRCWTPGKPSGSNGSVQQKLSKIKESLENSRVSLSIISLIICLLEEFCLSKGHFIALSPKCYFTWDEETLATKRSSKGVPHSCPLELQHYKNKLYGHEEHYSTIRSLRVVNNEMSRTLQQRSSLSDLFCKFRVQNDKVTCTSLTNKNGYL